MSAMQTDFHIKCHTITLFNVEIACPNRMSDQPDSRPVFTIVMGCNGVGKSAWKRHNYDQMPEQYFDQDSIAGGIGDWNSESAPQRTRTFVDGEILAAIKKSMDAS